MELAIINGSPRPGKSNSKKYIQSFLNFFKKDCPVFTSKTDMPEKIWEGVKNATDILFVFPLYADGIPVSLLKFLKTASDFPSAKGKRIHVLINCGFLKHNRTIMQWKLLIHFADRKVLYRVASSALEAEKLSWILPLLLLQNTTLRNLQKILRMEKIQSFILQCR